MKNFVFLIALTSSSFCYSDNYKPSVPCYAPRVPDQFSTDYERSSFQFDLQQYEYCIDDFVSEQKEQAQNHLDAASEAIEDWNYFVNFEL